MGFIYKIINNINNKIYVGQTSQTIEIRFKRHYYDSKRIRERKRPLYNAFNKYGFENFSILQLEECEDSQLNERETYWINQLKSITPNGYNCSFGGGSIPKFDKQKIIKKYLETKSMKKTGEFIGCDATTVRRYLYSAQVVVSKDPNKIRRKYNYKEIYKLYLKYLSVKKVIEITGCDGHVVLKAVKEFTQMTPIELKREKRKEDNETKHLGIIIDFLSAIQDGCL